MVDHRLRDPLQRRGRRRLGRHVRGARIRWHRIAPTRCLGRRVRPRRTLPGRTVSTAEVHRSVRVGMNRLGFYFKRFHYFRSLGNHDPHRKICQAKQAPGSERKRSCQDANNKRVHGKIVGYAGANTRYKRIARTIQLPSLRHASSRPSSSHEHSEESGWAFRRSARTDKMRRRRMDKILNR